MKLIEIQTSSREEVLNAHLQRGEIAHLKLRSVLVKLKESLTSEVFDELTLAQREVTEVRSEELSRGRRLVIGQVVRIPLPSKKY